MLFTPTPAPEFAAIYEESYFESEAKAASGYQGYRSEFTSHLVTFTQRIMDTENFVQRIGRLLDVGCALGHMGEAARRRGWDVYVTDVTEYAVHEARSEFGINGFVSSPYKLPVKNDSFDVITMYNVVEHLSHPIELLKSVRRALSSHGILHVVTPNVQSWLARLLGRHWGYFKSDSHYLYFSPETIRSLLERCGFEVLKIKSAPQHMRVGDVIQRLHKHWPNLASLLRPVVRFLGFNDVRVRINTGTMQIWAKPAEVRLMTTTRPVKDIMDIVCCPACRSEIQLFEDSEAICTQCELSFENKLGVINFSKYAKRIRERLVGSS